MGGKRAEVKGKTGGEQQGRERERTCGEPERLNKIVDTRKRSKEAKKEEP